MKQKNIYLDNGYLNFNAILDDDYPFSFIIGGRATGKTYGSLKTAKERFEDLGSTFIYMRRMKSQADLLSTDVFNPYKKLNADLGWNVQPAPVAKGVSGFYNDGTGACLGVIAAFSTFGNFRGFDASTTDLIIYDEFIRNAGERSIRDEGFQLMNVYETVNRNRELDGLPPVKMVCLSNSNSISNDIYIDLELVGIAEKQRKLRKNQYYLPERGIALYDLIDSDISRRKANTALYRMDTAGRYTSMSLNNEYEDYDTEHVKSEPLQEYKPLVKIGDVCIYAHKSEHRFYVTFHESGTFPHFNTTSVEKERFVRKYIYLWENYLNERISFESFLIKKIFEQLFM